ncbi:hypothetical protein DB895_04065 [Flavobacterium psychrotolerans]|uniref:Uncharacterized protein n=2 Tax=Flavobacterium psychrotolerans TaxID=2169410 RepID=A0A2U1JN59_9FLAO|nr:hypothetical protein DB895_04065 [Flavobacterium psychrotolerans]
MLLLTACKEQKTPAIAFYYWKTIFSLTSSEKNTLKENKVKKLYLRYFDIDLSSKSEQPYPQSPICFKEKSIDFTIVPVIYIKNKVLLSKSINVENLAKKTNDFIQQINTKNQLSCREIQIDCDWTLTSKDNYLKFITCFKKISGKKLSATIRLHQIKYFKKTAIPNVDKGVLMYYNMGKIAPDSLNSIYDESIADRYLKSIKKYPLSLNIALPIYSWAIHIRENKVIGLKSKIAISNLKRDSNFVGITQNSFRVKNNNYKNGTFYKANDLLKIESVSNIDLLEMAEDLHENIANIPDEIIFYDLDELNTEQYEKDIFTQVINRF